MSMKEAKIQFLVDAACDLFLSRSIFEVTIKDVALKAGVAEMTIYRAFEKKSNLVLAVALKLEERIESNYFATRSGKTGFERLKAFYESYLDIFAANPELYRFISEFDAFIKSERPEVSLSDYETGLDRFKERFLESYRMGLEDGSVRPVDDIEMFYLSTAHALLELCKKLSFSGDLLEQDKKVVKAEEIRMLIRIFLSMFDPSHA